MHRDPAPWIPTSLHPDQAPPAATRRVTLDGPCGLTPAQREEEMLLLQHAMRDALMLRHAYPETLATEVAQVCLQALRDKHGGREVWIYRDPAQLAERDAAILRAIEAGERPIAIARRLQVSRSTVWYAVRRARERRGDR